MEKKRLWLWVTQDKAREIMMAAAREGKRPAAFVQDLVDEKLRELREAPGE